MGEYKNNLGEGFGYDGLSGLFAIEFDMYSSVHKNLAINNNLMISVQVKNPKSKLLSSLTSSTLVSKTGSLNFAVSFLSN